jgi:hypothetical protein
MAKKRLARSSNDKGLIGKTDKLLIATISLLSALLILNVVTLTGFATKFGTDYGNRHYSENACERVGGIILRENVNANHNGRNVELKATSENAVAVEVDGWKRTIKSGHEVYINGVTVTNFVSNDNDACLILE